MQIVEFKEAGQLQAFRPQDIGGESAWFLNYEGSPIRLPYDSRPTRLTIAAEAQTFVFHLDRCNPAPLLKPILEDGDRTKIFHGAKTAVKHFLYHWSAQTRNPFCLYLAGKLLAMGLRTSGYGPNALSERFLSRHTGFAEAALVQPGSGDFGIEACVEIARLYRDIYDAMQVEINRHKLKKVTQLENRTVLPVAALELKGLYADRAGLEALAQTYRDEMRTLEEKLEGELQGPDALPGMGGINLNSPDQVKNALAERGIEVKDTAESTLARLAEEHPFLFDFLRYRHLGKILGSTLESLISHIHPKTGRIHSVYHQIASSSGRFACSDPNIQQVPRDPKVRRCLRAQPGYRFIVADYSQVELRVAAGFAKDPIMLKAYREGRDLHKLTAAITMGKSEEEVEKGERQAAKAINFGLIYAMGARGLQASAKSSYGVEMDMNQAELFRRRYFENYSGIRDWQQNLERQTRRLGYVRTAAGRIRSYQGVEMRVTEVYNIPVQGTAAEGLKSAMFIFYDRILEAGYDAAVVATIHDEIIVEVKQGQEDEVKTILEKAMVDGIAWLVPGVPFEAEAAIGDSWAVK